MNTEFESSLEPARLQPRPPGKFLLRQWALTRTAQPAIRAIAMLRFILAFLLAPFPAALLQAILVALWPISDAIGIYRHPLSWFAATCIVL